MSEPTERTRSERRELEQLVLVVTYIATLLLIVGTVDSAVIGIATTVVAYGWFAILNMLISDSHGTRRG